MQSVNRSFALLLWLGATLVGCSRDQAAELAAAQASPPPIEVLTLSPRTVSLDLQYPGRASGSREVEVRARVDGILLRRHYQEGGEVKAGAVLFDIDPQPYQVALERANAQLQLAEALWRTAQRAWERSEAVFAKGAISEADHDTARSTYEQAAAAVALAKAEREAARINLGYTSVTAPISGVTSREVVSEGSLVGPSQGTSLLTRLVQTDPLYVIFAIPESDYSALRHLSAQADPLGAKLLLGDGSITLEGGSIDFTASTVDAATGTVQARAVFANPGNPVLPGQFARVGLTNLTLDNALLVPQAAVMQGPQGAFVLSVNAENLVQFMPITTTMAVGSDWLVTAGLQSGARIITKGLLKVQPGMPVTPVPVTPATP